MATERQSSSLPPAQPSYIFRGHAAHIHSVQIVRRNSRLVTGDADGWVVYWNLESKRPVAVWKAHDAAILGTAEWGSDKLVTHGRDNSLRIWQIRAADELSLSRILPADSASTPRPKPWLLHSLPVNTLNFCSFSMCHERCSSSNSGHGRTELDEPKAPPETCEPVLVAVPSRDDRKIEVYRFPEEQLAYVVPRVQLLETGMVMAVKLTHSSSSKNIIAIAGYEGGYTAVHILGPGLPQGSQAPVQPVMQLARTVYISKPHSQPVLSLDASPDSTLYYTSSADAAIAAHRVPDLPSGGPFEDRPIDGTRIADASRTSLDSETCSIKDVPHSSDAKISDHMGNTSSRKSTTSSSSVRAQSSINEIRDSEKRGVGEVEATDKTSIDALTFPKKGPPTPPSTSLSLGQPSTTTSKPSGLSSLLATAPEQPRIKPKPPPDASITVLPPYRITHTKHAGQQSLHVRSDGRLLVTGGWDSRVRIYSTKSLKQLAVLKWHNEGVYAVGFGEILEEVPAPSSTDNGTGLIKLQRQRERQLQSKHWVVAGSKDGKVSLWEVY
ncbi:WD40 repeat-like protein [Lophiostoma macrostomum CBS 122681]|uniref:ASTRA-associated protein 1 n=1 Tax=Lophiostoma macrostomum CBS 122681 TaxID=1314788 RepID=A0A6A6TJ07_9PLEO|nr:WD40 repeat-like protein [Lophiostoma macrostomum CBS 122681]